MLDFVKFCREYRVPYLDGHGHHHCKAGWVQTHCPYCAGGREGWHLGWDRERFYFRCWRCGKLDFISAISKLMRGADPGAVRAAVSACQLSAAAEPVRKPKTRRPSVYAPAGLGPLLTAHLRYLEDRGFSPRQLAEDWGVKATGPFSDAGWAWRVVYPIRNREGRAVAYLGRAVGSGVHPKYKMTNDNDCLEDPSGFLYGIDRAKSDSVLIVEGSTGVFRFGAGAVATLGIDWKPDQANALRGYQNKYILFDPEPAAQHRARQLASHLSIFKGSTEILSGFKTDPGDFTQSKADRILRKLGLRPGFGLVY